MLLVLLRCRLLKPGGPNETAEVKTCEFDIMEMRQQLFHFGCIWSKQDCRVANEGNQAGSIGEHMRLLHHLWSRSGTPITAV